MARATAEDAAARRAQVADLDLRGVSARGIAKVLKSDPRTISRDVQLITTERERDTSLAGERYRLLGAARQVEASAWQLFAALPATDANGRLGALGKALAAQAQGLQVIDALAGLAIEKRLAELEARLDASAAPSGRAAWSLAAGRN